MELFGLIALLILLSPILAGVALSRSRRVERDLQSVQSELRSLSRQVRELSSETGVAVADAPPAEASPEATESDSTAADAAQATPEKGISSGDAEPPREFGEPSMADWFSGVSSSPSKSTEKAEASEEAQSASAGQAEPSQTTQGKGLEEALTSRWLVWLGGIAIALAGTFLVKYAIDAGYLGPATRVTLGLLLGMALVISGEWLRQRPLQRAIAAIRANHVPPALTASGLFVAFASIYSAYVLYDLLSPVVAFLGLGLVALLGIGLSLLHGPFVALLGLLGAFTAPALVVAPEPSVWALFGYLLVVEAACLAVARYVSWWWYAGATIVGALVWPVGWLSSQFAVTDVLPIGLYLLITAGAIFGFQYSRDASKRQQDWLGQMQTLRRPEELFWAAACIIALILASVIRNADYNAIGLILVGAISIFYILIGRWKSAFDGLPIVASGVALFVAATMPVPAHVTLPPDLPGSPILPPELGYFVGSNLFFGALFAISGFITLWGAVRPALWAGLSAAIPILLLIISYYRIVDFGVDFAWAFVALALAAVALLAAERVERYRAARGLEVSLGLYAAATVALISLAIAMSIREAWLTVALAMQLPALAAIHRRLGAHALLVIAAVLAGIVLVRLILNYNVFDYPLAENPMFSWVVYGYGLPALAFFGAARLFRGAKTEPLIRLLDAGALTFFVVLVSMQIRLFIVGSLVSPRYDLLEQSLHSIAWLTIGTALTWRDQRTNYQVARFGSRILLGAASFQVILLQLIYRNPLQTGDFVGVYAVINVLFLAYAVPAAFAFLLSYFLQRFDDKKPALYAASAGFVLVFAYISFEVARFHQGPYLSPENRSDAEIYTYSIVWLVYALVLLGLAIRFRIPLLRYASLAVVVLTTFKVFLFDMSDLTGLYRVGSFLGLGLVLVGVGYLYQRFVFRRPGTDRGATASPKG